MGNAISEILSFLADLGGIGFLIFLGWLVIEAWKEADLGELEEEDE